LTEQRWVKAELQLMLTRGTAIFLASLTACTQGRNDGCLVSAVEKEMQIKPKYNDDFSNFLIILLLWLLFCSKI